MSLDENDGSDMELDSDTSPESYYSQSKTVTTYNQCSNSSNMIKNKDNLLDNGKKTFLTSHSPQSETSSLQSSNSGSDHMSPVNSTMTSSIHDAPSQLPSPPSQGNKLENTMNILPKQTSPNTSQVTLTLNTTSSKQTNGSFLKSPMNKSPTGLNVSNKPTPLEKHDKIRFELKSTAVGFKHRSLSQIDKQSINTSTKNIFNVNNNVDMINSYDMNLDKESTFVNKSLSFSAKVSNSFCNKPEKVKQDCNNGDKRVIDDKFKEVVRNHVEEKKSHEQIFIENSLEIAEVNSVEIKKDLNDSSKLIRESSVVMDQLFNNNSTDENPDGKQIIDDNSVIAIEKNQIVISKGQDQEKNQIDDDDDSRIQGTNLEIVQEEQTECIEEIPQDTEVQIKNDDVVDEPLDLMIEDGAIPQDTEVQLKNDDDVVEPLDLMIEDGAVNNNINSEIQDIDNDDNKSTENPSLSKEGDKSDLMELDQVNIMPEKGRKNKANITKRVVKFPLKPNIIKVELSERMGNEKKDDKSETIPKIIDKGKNVALPANINKTVKIINQTAAVKTEMISKETNQEPDDSHLDHLTSLMTQFTNQINETARQANQINETSRQTNQINETSRQTNQINETPRQTNQYNNSPHKTNQYNSPHQTNHYNSPRQTSQYNSREPETSKFFKKVNNRIIPLRRRKEDGPVRASDLSSNIVDKYHRLDAALLEFDEVAKKAIKAYDELQKLLPEETVIKIDPPTAYKWDMLTNMLGVTDANKLEKYILSSQGQGKSQDYKEKKKGKNNSDEDIEDEVRTSSEIESDDEDMDIPSDDPDDKNFKYKSKQPNPKRWHNTRSNRPPSANLRQRTKVDPDSSNIATTPTTSNSSSKKKQPQTSSKRTLRTRKGEEVEADDDDDDDDDNDDNNNNNNNAATAAAAVAAAASSSQKNLDLDKFYEDGRPRRPANGFSYFCGDMCAKVRNEKLPISGTIAYAAEIWKKMTNEEKRPWLVRGEKSKNEYQDLLIRWKEEQEELKSNGIKRAAPPKAQSVFSYKKPRKDEQK